ncbi:MAG: sodium:proton antiporter [Planctomycetes bacterium]|nr:sodium:proton antiporter [Planctomycetota bacterium]
MKPKKPGYVNLLQEFSIPLIAGVLVALVHANLGWESYEKIVYWNPFAELFGPEWGVVFHHETTLHFLINDIFMVFFFGIAAKEITESILPGGSLNPIGKALNPLLSTLGGVVGPVGVFFFVLWVCVKEGLFPGFEWPVLANGWGIPTATDIALAWLVSRAVFGAGHPAVSFLLLLAVADDAIGLVIIAVWYGDPGHPPELSWLLLVLSGMVLAFVLRLIKVQKWQPYVLIAGPMAWAGLVLSNLHPALALVFIVPFLPGPKRDVGMFLDTEGAVPAPGNHDNHTPLFNFEHDLKTFVDLGLFFFAFANAGVRFTAIGPMTWIILGSLVVGKTVGITFFGWLALKMGMPLPASMGVKELVVAAFIGALGLTVALFVADAAFIDPELLGQAKMGALFSGFVGIVAIPLGSMLGIKKIRTLRTRPGGTEET